MNRYGDAMRVNFPQISIVDEPAERLQKYVSSAKGKLNRSRITLNTAHKIVSKCYGFKDYSDLRYNLSESPPQLHELAENQQTKLKQRQIDLFVSEFGIDTKVAAELWMAMTPCVELYDLPKRLKIGQIGRCTYEWDQPDEYGEATEYVNIYEYVIAVSCDKCSGTGKIIPTPVTQDSDMVAPSYYPHDDQCDLCEGSGIFHRESNKLNKIRLTKQQIELLIRWQSYHDSLEQKLRWLPWDCVEPKEQTIEYLERTYNEE